MTEYAGMKLTGIGEGNFVQGPALLFIPADARVSFRAISASCTLYDPRELDTSGWSAEAKERHETIRKAISLLEPEHHLR